MCGFFIGFVVGMVAAVVLLAWVFHDVIPPRIF